MAPLDPLDPHLTIATVIILTMYILRWDNLRIDTI